MLYFSGHLIETNEKHLRIKIKTVPMIWVLCFLAFEKGKNQTQILNSPEYSLRHNLNKFLLYQIEVQKSI